MKKIYWRLVGFYQPTFRKMQSFLQKGEKLFSFRLHLFRKNSLVRRIKWKRIKQIAGYRLRRKWKFLKKIRFSQKNWTLIKIFSLTVADVSFLILLLVWNPFKNLGQPPSWLQEIVLRRQTGFVAQPDLAKLNFWFQSGLISTVRAANVDDGTEKQKISNDIIIPEEKKCEEREKETICSDSCTTFQEEKPLIKIPSQKFFSTVANPKKNNHPARPLNNYAVENGRKVCAHEHDKPEKSGGKRHVDEDCCPDPDEYPNPQCFYSKKGYKIMLD